ncbi:MAG: TrkH family potassium uptake protein [candidate division WOR-3 bacterium]
MLILILVLYQVINLTGLSRSRFLPAVLGNIRQRPVRMLVISFLTLIAAGTLLLTFPAATTDGRGADILTALFTATSATCVTGLIVRDTGTYFSHFGQLVILTLIQLGGLGIMTFYTSIVVLLGQRMGLQERRTMQEIIEETRDIDIARMVRYVLLFTLTAEGIGMVILFLRWLFVLGSPGQALYFAAFHSISAFCNAGFSLFPDSFIRFQSDLCINLCIITLIVLGGLGFPVVNEIINRQNLLRFPRNFRQLSTNNSPRQLRLTLHSRIVLITTAFLITGGTILFFFLEYDNTLHNLPLSTKLLASLFQSVTARTAGFNTVGLSNLHGVTIFLWAILMFIGASPGGTGGGVKTSTIAVLFLAIRSRIRGEEEIVYFRRTIPKDVVYRAMAIIALSLGIIALTYAGLLFLENQRFESLLFEAISAFGTVGLSIGITPELNIIGKLLIIILMFIGRTGPLTLTLAMSAANKHSMITYPTARIIVG